MAGSYPGYPRSMLRAVLFDVDFTLARPGPELGPEGYRQGGRAARARARPRAATRSARLAALESLQRHPDHVHDDELWIAFTEGSSAAWAATADGARECADELVRAWEQHERFTLYEDALPALAELREHGVKIGLISNGSRDLDEFVSHHGLDADCAVGSRAFGRTKPHPEIFRHALALLERRARGGGDGRRLLRGRHRGRPRARDAGVPARPRRPPRSTSPTACPISSRFRPRSA